MFKPSITAPLPDGWLAKESITLLAPDGQANVIASSEPLDPDITTEQYARTQGDLLHTEFPAYKEHGFQPWMLFGERSGYLREFSWTPPDGVSVTQIQLYYAEPGRGYTATATTPTSEYDRYRMVLLAVLTGLLIDAVSPPGTAGSQGGARPAGAG